MAHLGNTFDPSQVPEDERSFEPMPAGDYVCQVIESEVVQTKSGGDMLKLTLEVTEGQFANRRVWDNLNIRNNNPQAQQIAHRALADLCSACGVGPITDSEDLHFRPFVATLKIEPAREVNGQTYDARNGVKRYKPKNGTTVVAAQGSAARPAPAAQAAAARPARPWGNGAAARPVAGDPPF